MILYCIAGEDVWLDMVHITVGISAFAQWHCWCYSIFLLIYYSLIEKKFVKIPGKEFV